SRPGTVHRSSASASTSRTCSSPTPATWRRWPRRRRTGAICSPRTPSARRSCAGRSATRAKSSKPGIPAMTCSPPQTGNCSPNGRGDSYCRPGKYRLDMRLDLERAAAELGDDHVLLIRRHPNVVDTVPEVAGGFVRDVSAYPDIAELFLISDVLVTDYSSLM